MCSLPCSIKCDKAGRRPKTQPLHCPPDTLPAREAALPSARDADAMLEMLTRRLTTYFLRATRGAQPGVRPPLLCSARCAALLHTHCSCTAAPNAASAPL